MYTRKGIQSNKYYYYYNKIVTIFLYVFIGIINSKKIFFYYIQYNFIPVF